MGNSNSNSNVVLNNMVNLVIWFQVCQLSRETEIGGHLISWESKYWHQLQVHLLEVVAFLLVRRKAYDLTNQYRLLSVNQGVLVIATSAWRDGKVVVWQSKYKPSVCYRFVESSPGHLRYSWHWLGSVKPVWHADWGLDWRMLLA